MCDAFGYIYPLYSLLNVISFSKIQQLLQNIKQLLQNIKQLLPHLI